MHYRCRHLYRRYPVKINIRLDTLVNILLLIVAARAAILLVQWLVLADWNVIVLNIPLYVFGSYPAAQRWRPLLWLLLLLSLTVLTLVGLRYRVLRRTLPIFWSLTVPSGVALLAGGFGLVPVRSHEWGGLTLTLFLSVCSGVLALPIGVLLALGRRSGFVLIAHLCILFIEVMRAIPLIAVLFFGQLLIPLFLPVNFEVSRVMRAVLALSFFTAAYVAEDVRSGLQAVPSTQEEAAAVLGLGPIQSLRWVILPQALRIALPVLTNQAIAILQSTTLLALLGLVELLGVSRSLLGNPTFIGRHLEVYVALAVVYWIICSAIALLSRRLEQQLNASTTTR
ncbi:amino acid ABC transporter permease [cyanobiont of Ornithocercus magnificus]|nr:amino acid ABC transporter permease [cyanobiont of Ornithocercus magnificus]